MVPSGRSEAHVTPLAKNRKGCAADHPVPPWAILPGFAFGSINLTKRAYGTPSFAVLKHVWLFGEYDSDQVCPYPE